MYSNKGRLCAASDSTGSKNPGCRLAYALGFPTIPVVSNRRRGRNSDLTGRMTTNINAATSTNLAATGRRLREAVSSSAEPRTSAGGSTKIVCHTSERFNIWGIAASASAPKGTTIVPLIPRNHRRAVRRHRANTGARRICRVAPVC